MLINPPDVIIGGTFSHKCSPWYMKYMKVCSYFSKIKRNTKHVRPHFLFAVILKRTKYKYCQISTTFAIQSNFIAQVRFGANCPFFLGEIQDYPDFDFHSSHVRIPLLSASNSSNSLLVGQ